MKAIILKLTEFKANKTRNTAAYTFKWEREKQAFIQSAMTRFDMRLCRRLSLRNNELEPMNIASA